MYWGEIGVNCLTIPHCSRKVNVDETWFLNDNDEYFRRKFHIVYECPVCGHRVGYLVQTDKKTRTKFGKFFKEKNGELAKAEYNLLPEILYTSKDINPMDKRAEPFGLCFGEYKETVKDGKVVKVVEKRKDFYGNSEVLNVF